VSPIVVSRRIECPPEVVWDHLADLEGHAEWMGDAERISFVGPARRGVGTAMIVRTRVGPFRTDDVLEVIGWEEGSSITVRHGGTVSGVGELRVDADGQGSKVTWTETLRFPWWLGGPVAAWFATPVLRRVWRRNLDGFAGILENKS